MENLVAVFVILAFALAILSVTSDISDNITGAASANRTYEVARPSERGLANCGGTFLTQMRNVIDGSSFRVEGCSRVVKLALVETPNSTNKTWHRRATLFLRNFCPPNSTVEVNTDSGKKYDPMGRLNAVVSCESRSMNAHVIYSGHGKVDTAYCDRSEFANYTWVGDTCRKIILANARRAAN